MHCLILLILFAIVSTKLSLNCWIDRGRSLAWPPHFPDLTLSDLWLSDMIKDNVCSKKVTDIKALKDRRKVSKSDIKLSQ